MHLIFVIDLDGTMYDNTHRQHLIPEDRSHTEGWIAFNGACAEDTPRWPVASLVDTLIASAHDVRFLTGRGEAAREPTVTRLSEDLSMFHPKQINCKVFMRQMDDHRPAPYFKLDVVTQWLTDEPDAHVMMLEDDPAIVEVMRHMERVTVLQIDSLCADVRTK